MEKGESLPMAANASTAHGQPANPDGHVDPSSVPPVAKKAPHVASLDGLRAVAVFLVMGVNAGLPGAGLGWLGVDLFFVLSGFLITTLLLKEFQSTGRIHLLRFWGRRFLRLMPAYWLYVGAITGAILFLPGAVTGEATWSPGWFIASMWGYFVNYAPDSGVWRWHHLTGHLWSLAVEEQFYLIWPVICAVAIGSRRLAYVAWALAAGVFAYRFFATDWEIDRLLYTRGLGIFLGCATALTIQNDRTGTLRSWMASRIVRILVLVALVLLYAVGMASSAFKALPYFQAHRILEPVFVVGFAFLVAMLWHGPGDGIARALAWRPLAYVGRISYGVYLYNPVAQVIVWEVLLRSIDHWNKWTKYSLRFSAFVLATLLLASLSYHVLEKPFLALKDRLR